MTTHRQKRDAPCFRSPFCSPPFRLSSSSHLLPEQDRYSRQIGAFGMEAMLKLVQMRVRTPLPLHSVAPLRFLWLTREDRFPVLLFTSRLASLSMLRCCSSVCVVLVSKPPRTRCWLVPVRSHSTTQSLLRCGATGFEGKKPKRWMGPPIMRY